MAATRPLSGCFRCPQVCCCDYFVVVQLATTSKAAHAFRVSAAAGHITMSVPPQIGLPVAAANVNRVVVDGLLPAFSMAPASLDFGTVDVDDDSTAAIQISNAGAADLILFSISSGDARFAAQYVSLPADLVVPPGDSRPVTVTFSPDTGGALATTVDLVHNDVSSPTLILLSGADVALANPAQVLPLSVDFGSIVPGKTALLPLTIDNPSVAAVTIISIVSDNPTFVPDCSTCVIAAGDQQTIYVTFRPTSTQAQSARLSITHNPRLIVNLVANGFKDDFSQSLDADGKPPQTMAVPFGGEWLAGVLFCLYALIRRRAS
jgi:hypothetical protein